MKTDKFFIGLIIVMVIVGIVIVTKRFKEINATIAATKPTT
jgi:hypothetical protein